MNLPDFASFSVDELKKFAAHASSEKIESAISRLTLPQISTIAQQVDETVDPQWKKKTRAIVLGLNSREQLETAGKHFSLNQFIELIDHTLQIEDKHHWKLSPLLVGMPRQVFSQFIYQAGKKQIHLLQCEGVTEPVQHQLTTLSHEMTAQIDRVIGEIDDFTREIEELKTENLSRDDISEIEHRIGLYGKFFQRLLDKSNNALAIAWNTSRADLIESLNKVKDSCTKYILYGVGTPKSDESRATGLYAALEQKILSVFGDPNDSKDPEAAKDNEPAIEALVKFSMWYLKDYWEMGLLPSVKSLEKLDLDLTKHSEADRIKHREELFSKVKENLIKVGLSTVKDLKKAGIFSKKTLHDYINDKKSY